MESRLFDFSVLMPMVNHLRAGADDELIWQCADHALSTWYGHKLFTILAYNREAGVLQRLYSSRPDINAIGGMKRVTQSEWVNRVLIQGEGYLGASAADLTRVFSDHAVLISHGLESVLNVSVCLEGEVVGSLNLLHGAGHYDDSDSSAALLLAQLLAPRLAAQASEFALAMNLESLDTV